MKSKRTRQAKACKAFRRTLTLWVLSHRAFWLSMWLLTVSSMLRGPLGLKLLPGTVRQVRALADRQRAYAAQWTGVDIPAVYAELPPTGAGQAKALRAQLLDKGNQVHRDWRWAHIDAYAGGTIAAGPLVLLLTGVWGLWTAAVGTELSTEWDSMWFLFIPVGDPATATLAGVLGAACLPLSVFWAAPRALKVHARYLRTLLAPSETELLAARVEHLKSTRTDAVDTQMSEIRRIERDLHDGAQARLVAMGMTLNAAEHLLETKPEAVRDLLIEARESSTAALKELRDLVKGIHPPILADRGLADAVRSLAMISPLRTEVVIDLPARPEPPVESAMYFAVSELLTNAAKHSEAERCWIDLRYEAGALRVSVADDGQGGADVSAGTGLLGVERRLAHFDGVLAVSSPAGGPTLLTMELPCELSSPKTTSS
ncbi:sensor histidine kinase [Streptomyces aureoverticillatus]|uniref:sensor histidine kinase n=1 Tax=Streptomyces aureoverticillatus TaxID=66871 RepID=UPI0013DAC4AE|nr:histidine kinase [Streptomyces aureoverticillatus]QIB44422.1 sensor histidine kinase [Streptomyces aureoverticillatus]